MTFANNFDQDNGPQNVGLHLSSKLFDIQIIYQQKKLVGNKDILQILKKKILKKNYPAFKELVAAPVTAWVDLVSRPELVSSDSDKFIQCNSRDSQDKETDCLRIHH